MTIICVVMHVLLRISVFYFTSNVLQPSECEHDALLRRHVGKYMANHVLLTEQTESEFECVTHCVGHSSTCASMNYKISGTDVGKCELNSKALQAETMNLDEDPDFSYLDFTRRMCSDSDFAYSPDAKLCLPVVPSCKELLLHHDSLPNGEYTLKRNMDSSPYKTYCHMTDIPVCGGGGWTLALKVDGSKQTFGYDSTYWTNKESYAIEDGLEGLTEKESKLASYWNTSFKKICLGMTVNGDKKWIVIDYDASSLHSLIADGQYRATSISSDSFKSLISGSSMQPHCNRQGFNVNLQNPEGPEYGSIRFGLLGNNEEDCNTCDSWIGLGARYNGCGVIEEMACGNRAVCVTDTGSVNIPAFGYLLVQ